MVSYNTHSPNSKNDSFINAALILSECINEKTWKETWKETHVHRCTWCAKSIWCREPSILSTQTLYWWHSRWWLASPQGPLHKYDHTSQMRWVPFFPLIIKQGIRQGGILSVSHYKRCNNPLLLEIGDKFTGKKIGTVKIPHVTCADVFRGRDLEWTSTHGSHLWGICKQRTSEQLNSSRDYPQKPQTLQLWHCLVCSLSRPVEISASWPSPTIGLS